MESSSHNRCGSAVALQSSGAWPHFSFKLAYAFFSFPPIIRRLMDWDVWFPWSWSGGFEGSGFSLGKSRLIGTWNDRFGRGIPICNHGKLAWLKLWNCCSNLPCSRSLLSVVKHHSRCPFKKYTISSTKFMLLWWQVHELERARAHWSPRARVHATTKSIGSIRM